MSPHPKSVARLVAGIAVAGLVVATALPAEAQLFRRHNDGSVSIDPLLCQTDYQVRQSIVADGFSNVALNAPIEDHVQARGTKGKWVYLIDFNRCSGGIEGVQRLRPAS
jgi:hypothetical protein